jgi:uncharacterized membrane protein
VDDITIARAIHVLAVVHWIGGLAFVTLVVLPALAAVADPGRRLELFEMVEGRFSAQVKVSVPLAGLSGAYMAERLEAWQRFVQPSSWWLMAMALTWLSFMVILFVVEPFVLAGRFRRLAAADPDGTFWLLRRVHWLLLAAGTAVAAAGVLGAHGLLD